MAQSTTTQEAAIRKAAQLLLSARYVRMFARLFRHLRSSSPPSYRAIRSRLAFGKLFRHPEDNGKEQSTQATLEDITAAYRIFLKRNPDPNGFDHYKRLVANGLTLDRLIAGFTNSDEYRERIIGESAVVPVDLGGYVVCVRQSETDFGKALIATQQYEPHVRSAIRELLKEGQTFVDIGANVGCITFLAAQIVGPKGRVVAIEPNPDNLQLLYAGIVLNGFENVCVLPYAASNARRIFSLTGGTSNTYLVPAKHYKEVSLYTQSIVLDEELAHLPAIDFVKMDIEGHEPSVLQGFSSLIRKHNPILLTEFNPRCLVDVQGTQPIAYVEQLLTYYSRLQVITPFGDSVTFTDADAVMQYWWERDRDLVRQKLLPERMLHFDVIATNT